METAIVGENGAIVYTDAPDCQQTEEKIPAGTNVSLGMMYEAPFNDQGQRLDGFKSFSECMLPNGRTVWLDNADLAAAA